MGAPIKKFWEKGNEIAIWKDEKYGYTASYRKTYKDKNTGEYKTSAKLFRSDLENLRTCINKALAWWESEPKDDAERKSAPEPKHEPQAFDDSDIPF
jgi:hypothetical protein